MDFVCIFVFDVKAALQKAKLAILERLELNEIFTMEVDRLGNCIILCFTFVTIYIFMKLQMYSPKAIELI